MFKNALVSVTDKTGLAEFLRPHVQAGLRVVSTGGTAQYLRENGIVVVEVAEQTGYPEVMDGRVRTLHPRIYMPVLARTGIVTDSELLAKENLEAFDLVIVNLYQFSNYAGKNLPDQQIVEYIDIGGPSLLRAAAKNFERIVVLCDPQDYSRATRARDEFPLRKELSAKVFRHVSRYDQLIARELEGTSDEPRFTVTAELQQKLRYGENPHQSAAWYRRDGVAAGWHQAEILQGKELSYNNLLDLDAGVSALRQFELPTCVVLKHNNACGLASDLNLDDAVRKALQSDPVSSFGGIVALNREVDVTAATTLAEIFLECIVAPNFTPAALEVFSKKKNLRILRWRNLLTGPSDLEFRSIAGGVLVQQVDAVIDWKDSWRILDGPNIESVENFRTDLLFAFRLVTGLKSNAIALVQNQQSVGLGMGQVNRVDSVLHACARGRQVFGECKNLVLASDAFFPFPDSIDAAHAMGVKWIIQPGGSKNDPAVVARARELGIGMVMTGERHFRH